MLNSDALSICSKYTSKAGQALSVVTDPVCSATCRIRLFRIVVLVDVGAFTNIMGTEKIASNASVTNAEIH
ncbi:unnamed protein product [Nippostrongylus brasiliensis]|uniref:Uncharacterized protein n=1 Tax=Nippostrongylus brasiliensis TaxID=27835 RepID=A0A0N4XV34_NIPBR|nr:unnamed protein product [Nippostrongylus brasiliensis]